MNRTAQTMNLSTLLRNMEKMGIHYQHHHQVRDIPRNLQLPLEINQFAGVQVFDFVVYFAGKYYPAKRIVSRPLNLNTCVYNWGDMCKVLGFVPADELMPYYEYFTPDEYKTTSPVRIVFCANREGLPVGQREEYDGNLFAWDFQKVMGEAEMKKQLIDWLKQHRAM